MEPKKSEQIPKLSRTQRLQEILNLGFEIDRNKNTIPVNDTLSRIPILFDLVDKVTAGSTLQDKIDNPTELVMDVQLLKLAHKIVGSVLQNLANSDFSDAEYALELKNLLNLDVDDDSHPLLKYATQIMRRPKSSINMLGTINPESLNTVALRKERMKRDKVPLGIEKKPTQASTMASNDKSSLVLNIIMNQIIKIFRERGKPIPYFELITDPTDFMYTVDNAFQVSFLIKDGSVALETGIEDFPNIRPLTKTEKSQNEDMQKKHKILSFSPSLWRSMIKKYHIKTALLDIKRNDFANTSKSVN